MIECPACGADNRTRAQFCVVCGKNLKQGEAGDKSQASPALKTLEEGKLLGGRFKVTNLMNVGGMGYIYQGEDILLKKNVAIKEMIDRFTDSGERSDAIERFRREAEILCKLNHPAIPTFFEYFVENQRYYMVMDLVEGLDLRKVVKRTQAAGRKIPLERIIHWALEICDVLDYLHSRKPPIVYRDLKPSNIMISPDGKVKLIDFGIARLFTSSVKATMVGTQGYAPPEQYRGGAEPRSDIYALGATLHHLLTGKDPQFEAPFHFEPIRKLNPEIPISLEKIIEKALHLVPGDRFQTARDLKVSLANMIVQEDKFTDLHREIKDIEKEISSLRQRKTKILQADIMAGEERAREISGLGVEQKKKGEWSHFRGNRQRTGLSTVATHLKGRLHWKKELGRKITSSPIVDHRGKIYIGCHDESLHCLDPKGEKLWSFATRGAVSGSPALGEKNMLYVPSEDGILYGIDRNGKEKWRFTTRDAIKSSPLVGENKIYFGGTDGIFYCLDYKGEGLWTFPVGSPMASSAALTYDGTVVFGTQEGEVLALKPNGELRWRTRLPKIIYSTPAISPEGLILVGCEDGILYAINLFGKPVWKFKTRGWIRSSAAVGKDGTIYVGSSDHKLYAIDKEGIEKWRFNLENVSISSPAVSDDGTIHIVSPDGVVFALDSWGKSRWWFNLAEIIHSSPAIGPKGKLYIGTHGGWIYAIE